MQMYTVIWGWWIALERTPISFSQWNRKYLQFRLAYQNLNPISYNPLVVVWYVLFEIPTRFRAVPIETQFHWLFTRNTIRSICLSFLSDCFLTKMKRNIGEDKTGQNQLNPNPSLHIKKNWNIYLPCSFLGNCPLRCKSSFSTYMGMCHILNIREIIHVIAITNNKLLTYRTEKRDQQLGC